MKTSSDVDWQSLDSHLIINPRLQQQLPLRLRDSLPQHLPKLPGHLWLSTSGTTSDQSVKLVALSKAAFLVAAQGANQHLEVHAHDRWLNVLPLFHVGALAIHARAHLSQSLVVDKSVAKWNPESFVTSLADQEITLTSLVPTQIVDLVAGEFQAPSSLRAVVVGGGAMNSSLFARARSLGWPCLPSYGFTEACSQVATAELSSLTERPDRLPALRLLPHIQARIAGDVFVFKSESLLTTYAHIKADSIVIQDPKVEGWFETKDRGEIMGETLVPLGRVDEQMKVLGELVNLAQINERLQKLAQQLNFTVPCVLHGLPDERMGHRIVAVAEARSFARFTELVARLNSEFLPFERVHGLYWVDRLPVTELGKIRRTELTRWLR